MVVCTNTVVWISRKHPCRIVEFLEHIISGSYFDCNVFQISKESVFYSEKSVMDVFDIKVNVPLKLYKVFFIPLYIVDPENGLVFVLLILGTDQCKFL